MLVLGFLISTALWVLTDAQVSLTYNSVGNTLDVRCSIKDIRPINISSPVSLSLTRLENNSDKLLAAVTLTPGASPSIKDVQGATVSTVLSPDGTSESYLELHWPLATSRQEGQYTCLFIGLNGDYHSIEFAVQRAVTLSGVQPVFSVSPQTIQVGLTRNFNLRCSFANLAANNVSRIELVELFDKTAGGNTLLARVTLFSDAESKLSEQRGGVVSGSVNANDSETYLEIGWEFPTHNDASQYICDMLGLDLAGAPVHFQTSVNVTSVDSSQEDLIARTHTLETNLTELTSSCTNTIMQLQDSNAFLMSPMSCNEALLNSSHQVVRLYSDRSQSDPVDVLCEVTDDGVWTVFQKRFDFSVNFNRSFAEYENGFGSVKGEFWLGFKTMNRLMGNNHCDLLMEMTSVYMVNFTRLYLGFTLERPYYRILISSNYEDYRYGMSYHIGRQFFTYDRDSHDIAKRYGGGWWFGTGNGVLLNGRPDIVGFGDTGFTWWDASGTYIPLRKSKMKFKCQNI